MTQETERDPHIPPKYQADYSHWNLMRTVTIRQAVYLTVGVEPGTDIRNRSIKAQFERILELAESWAGSDSLPCNDFYCTEVLPVVWLDWLKRMDISAQNEWDPIKQKDKVKPKPELQRAEALSAAILMVQQGTPPGSMQDVVIFMQKHSAKFHNCCGGKIKDTSLIKAINQRGGGDPLESNEYKSALAHFETDRADKSDKIRKLPLMSLPKTK